MVINGTQGDVNHCNVMPLPGELNGLKRDFDAVDRGYDHAKHMANVLASAALSKWLKCVPLEAGRIRFATDSVRVGSQRAKTPEELALAKKYWKLHQEGKQIVITSDKPPKELLTLEERLRTRFEGGLIADISAPDYETRLAIINRKSELLELKMPSEVAEFMANRLKSNIRQLEGAVVRLKALNHFAGSPITISMAQSVMRDVLADEQPIPITVEKIISEVSTVYGVSPDDLRSSKRSSQISTARKVAIYVVREITQMPLASIGTEFGGRDHSTIVYSVTSVTESMEKDSNLKNLVNDIIKNIKDKSKV